MTAIETDKDKSIGNAEETAPENENTHAQHLAKALRRRNIAVGLTLLGVVVIFFALTVVRLGPAVFTREI